MRMSSETLNPGSRSCGPGLATEPRRHKSSRIVIEHYHAMFDTVCMYLADEGVSAGHDSGQPDVILVVVRQVPPCPAEPDLSEAALPVRLHEEGILHSKLK